MFRQLRARPRRVSSIARFVNCDPDGFVNCTQAQVQDVHILWVLASDHPTAHTLYPFSTERGQSTDVVCALTTVV